MNSRRQFRGLFGLSLLVLLTVTACRTMPKSTISKPTEIRDRSADPSAISEASPPGIDTESEETMSTDFGLTLLVLLAQEGLEIVADQPENSRIVPFGTDIEEARAEITEALGAPRETVENAECDGGALATTTWDNGFSVQAKDNDFVGWSVRPNTPSAQLTTADDIGLGSTLTSLKGAETAEDGTTVRVFESSLGTEFTANQLGGLLSSNAPEGKIVALWGGSVCAVR